MVPSVTRTALTAAFLAAAVGFPGSASADAEDVPRYQIVKATESRIWRLDTQTGEIAVCSLQAEHLVCTSSAQAITPPKKSYADLEAERREQERLDAQEREDKRKRRLAMLNLMMNAFKEIAIAGSAVGDAP